jgi:hypothetical protein
MHDVTPEQHGSSQPGMSVACGVPPAPGRWQLPVLVVLTAAVFAPSLWFGFVYDALTQVLTDTYLFDPKHWLDVLTFRVLGQDVFDFNRPLQIASLMLDAAIWGRNPFGYHLTSVLLHAVNVALVWLVVSELTSGAVGDGNRSQSQSVSWACLVGSAVFAVHPVMVEAVCEPTYREDLLVTFFSLLALLLAMRHAPATSGWDAWRAFGCMACCLLAAAAKESAMATPAMLVVYRWLVRRGEPGRFWQAALGGSVAVTLAFFAARFLLDPTPALINDEKPGYLGGSLGQAILIQPRILAFYAQLIALPVNLSADYGGESIRHLSLAVALMALAGIVVAGWLAAQRDRRLLFAFAMILFPLLPVSNLVPIFRPFADRYLYFAMAGVAAVVACLLDAPWLTAHVRRWCLIASVAAVAMLGLASIERQKIWANSLALWSDTYAKNPGSFTAARNLAVALCEVGRLDEAEKAAQQAILLTNGTHASLWAILAIILDEKNQPQFADRALKQALDLPLMADPDALMARLYMDRDLALRLKKVLDKRGISPAGLESKDPPAAPVP